MRPPRPLRAIHERMLAAQVTASYGREQVLEWYLNSADYGHYAYGAEAAAQLYLENPSRKSTWAKPLSWQPLARRLHSIQSTHPRLPNSAVCRSSRPCWSKG